MLSHPRFTALLVLLVAIVPGCGDAGPKTYPVQGKVSYQGKLLEFGLVMLVPDDGPAAPVGIEPDGSYKANLVAGRHRVGVICNPPPQGRPDPTREGGVDTTGVAQLPPIVPVKYGQYDTSGIEIEVKPTGENVINIELK